ncbi:alpha/beta hydrolase [Amycolatopsis sp. RTGN1]|uniref:alpha/beta hydrolase n=1 Tax=Amycolatopsis ponsaeliensis TaxID=2992142 RepID=UPI00254B1199|nr:alpha/beta hydrolase [Amycolatopsis sp. RTGN1]
MPLTASPPRGRTLEVAGRALFLDRAGSGGPPVVVLPGAGLVGLDYLNVHTAAAEFTTSVLYDRAGTGWSDPVALPRTAAEVATELRDLLRTAGVDGPYVLAGHSLGASYARRFAQLFPADVAGLLLLDPGHEDLFAHLPAEAVELNDRMKQTAADMPDLTEDQLATARGQYAELFAQWPEDVREALAEHHLTTWRTVLGETANEDDVYAELRAGGQLPDVPLIVLTAMGRNPYWSQFGSEELIQAAQRGIRDLHASIAAGSSRGEHRVLDDAAHQFLHIQRKDAVLRAIRDLTR